MVFRQKSESTSRGRQKKINEVCCLYLLTFLLVQVLRRHLLVASRPTVEFTECGGMCAAVRWCLKGFLLTWLCAAYFHQGEATCV